jgi:hypothetical protein
VLPPRRSRRLLVTLLASDILRLLIVE